MVSKNNPRMRLLSASLVTLGLATAMHVDWHFARPAIHHRSLGWEWHWLFALPVFALTAWYVWRVWADHAIGASLSILGAAVVLAGFVEPAWEYWLGGASVEWAFGRERWAAFGAFTGVGAVVHAAVLTWARRLHAS